MNNNSVHSKSLILFFIAMSFSACRGANNKNVTYDFAGIRRGNLERTVSSGGTIHPVATVKVLPRMSGKVEAVYVDYNDPVKKGDILAELNTDMLRLQREQQNASVLKARANYELQLINYRSQQALAEKNLISEYELKTSKTTLDNQAADLAVAEANLKVIETEITQYAYITSPIDGIVLDKNVNVGDTVVDSSNNNSTSIFVLAENLREMQIDAVVGELDITSIRKGQTVRFSLESLPGRSFTGLVDALRMVPVTSNNVVSYTVIISVENPDGSLMPGMTCAVDFIIERYENVLTVPNAALRYTPSGLSAEKIEDMVFNAGLVNMSEEQRGQAVEERAQARKAQSSGQNQSANSGISGLMMGQPGPQIRMMGGGGRQGQGNRQGQPDRRERPVVMRNLWFINDEGRLDVMSVRCGTSDGSSTEIMDENLEGRQVILREKI